MNYILQHGRRSTYINHKCRCVECTRVASEYSVKWNKNNPDKAAASNKKWAKSNPDKIKNKRDKYRSSNKEKSREQFINWKKNNPEKYKANKQKYRARKFNANHGCVNGNSIFQIIKLNNNMCVYCGAPYEHIDHIVALASGGLHCVENLTTACASCNLNKWSKSVENWLADTIDIKTLECKLGESSE